MIQARLVTAARTVAGSDKTKLGMWHDDLTAILCDDQRGTFQNVIEPSQFSRLSKIHFINDQQMAMLDSQCQRSIHKGHVAINQRVVTDKIGQLQSTVRSNLLNRPIQSRSNLAN